MINDFETAAAEYFALHLERKIWESLTAAERQSAIAGAVNDLTDYLGAAPPAGSETVKRAVCEQALWLVKQQRSKPQIVSESIEGLGSRSYLARGEIDDGEIVCVRSRRILAPVIKSQMGKLSRG